MFDEAIFSSSVIWYLFFAGAGSGLAFVVFVLDSWMRRFRVRLFVQYRPLIAPGLIIASLLTLVGMVFLLFDLGRPERILALALHPSLNALTVGAWSLVSLVVLAALQLVLRLRLSAVCPKVVHLAVRWMTAASALLVMVYTGVLLQGLRALHFLATPLLPLLFVLSSLSCGVGALLLLGFFRQNSGNLLKPYVRLAHAHLPLLLAESLTLGAYLLVMSLGTPTAANSAARLLTGDFALPFWGGVVALGLALPLGLEVVLRGHNSWNSTAVYALACVVGALALRFCILAVGEHPALSAVSSPIGF
jgi:formate-dependent nitrite reductase membrane component NrfD